MRTNGQGKQRWSHEQKIMLDLKVLWQKGANPYNWLMKQPWERNSQSPPPKKHKNIITIKNRSSKSCRIISKDKHVQCINIYITKGNWSNIQSSNGWEFTKTSNRHQPHLQKTETVNRANATKLIYRCAVPPRHTARDEENSLNKDRDEGNKGESTSYFFSKTTPRRREGSE